MLFDEQKSFPLPSTALLASRPYRVQELLDYPDSKVHRANVGPTWGRQDPGGPYVGHMNFAIWVNRESLYSHFTDLNYQ